MVNGPAQLWQQSEYRGFEKRSIQENFRKKDSSMGLKGAERAKGGAEMAGKDRSVKGGGDGKTGPERTLFHIRLEGGIPRLIKKSERGEISEKRDSETSKELGASYY